ncbi:MAG: hypothetical protein QOI41_3160, partial [Myxococcales bacterium]|nr:hypothetical protein [Myxococcales bacterium]
MALRKALFAAPDAVEMVRRSGTATGLGTVMAPAVLKDLDPAAAGASVADSAAGLPTTAASSACG